MKDLTNSGVRGFRLYASKAEAVAWHSSTGLKAVWSQAADDGIAMWRARKSRRAISHRTDVQGVSEDSRGNRFTLRASG